MTRAKRLSTRCDVVHPETGEVLAEPGEALLAQTSRAQYILDVAKAYPEHYIVVQGVHGSIVIAATYDEAVDALEMIAVLEFIEHAEV